MNILLSVFLMLMPAVKLENGRFNIYQDGKKIGAEEFSIVSRGAGFTAEGRVQITAGNQTLQLRSRMELDPQLRPTYYEVESRGNRIKLKIEQPLSELETIVQGKSQPQDVRFPPDGAILDENFFHHYLLLLYRSNINGANVPTFVPQQMTIGAVTIRTVGERTYSLETPDVRVTATTDADGRMVRLTVPDAKVIVER